MNIILSGDIGGTNARFVLFKDGVCDETSMRTLPVAAHRDLSDTIADYLASQQGVTVNKIALSVASTAEYIDHMQLTNCDVGFKVSNLVKRFSLQRARVVNDFTAAALGVVTLPEKHLKVINTGTADNSASRAVIGAGTGLGVSGLVNAGTHWIPLQGQGGHVSMAAQTDRELKILNALSDKYGHVSAERYLSGPGTVGVYQAICTVDGLPCEFTQGKDISANAINASCPVCVEVMQLFCKWLGVVTGDLAVTLGSSGGIYLAGGIVPSLGEYFLQSDFIYWLQHKGRFSDFVKAMPVWLVTGGEPALYGAHRSLEPFYDGYGYTVS